MIGKNGKKVRRITDDISRPESGAVDPQGNAVTYSGTGNEGGVLQRFDSTGAVTLSQPGPKSLLPALAVDGMVLTENVAILTYLAKRFPEAQLLPRGIIEEARIAEIAS